VLHYHLTCVGPDPHHPERKSRWKAALCTTEDGARAELMIESECGKGKRVVNIEACLQPCFGTRKDVYA
jgi:hypothetical protein